MLPLKQMTPVEDILPNYDVFERIDAAQKLGNTDTFVENHLRDGYLDELQGMKTPEGFGEIQPEEANKLFPNVEVPFSKPIPYFVAQELDTVGKKRRELNDIISNKGRGSWGGNLAISMAGGAIAHATDPIEAGADILMSLGTGGVGLLLSEVNKARNSAKIATMANMLQSKTFTKSIVEGTIANTALEGQNYKSSTRAQFDYGMQDAITSIVGGGILFPTAVHGTMKGIPAAYKYMRNKYEANGAAFKTGVGNVLRNILPSSEGVTKYYNKLFNQKSPNAPTDSLRAKFTHSPIDGDEGLRDIDFYVASREKINELNLDDMPHHTFDTDFGDGVIHMTSDPNKAYNMAGDHLSDSLGEVHAVNISPSKIINADSVIDSDVGFQIRELISDPELRRIYEEAPSIKEGFDNIRDALEISGEDLTKLNDITNKIKELGYDGFRYVMKNELGEDTAHGIALLKGFDNKKYKGSSSVDRQQVPNLDDKEVKEVTANLLSKENEIGYSKALQKELDETKAEPKLTEETIKATNEKKMKDIENLIEVLEKSEELSPENQAIIKLLKDQTNEEIVENEVIDAYIACLIGNLDE